jgi:hypothetical protein
VPPREVAADNYAGAAIFRIGAPANKNVRAFLCIAQGQYLKITDGEDEREVCEKAPHRIGWEK